MLALSWFARVALIFNCFQVYTTFLWRFFMKTCALLKHIGLAAIALTVAIGCSTSPTTESETAEPMAMNVSGISAEAEQAIAWAKAVRFRANGLGCEWDDTGELIDDAQTQGDAGNNERAILIANEAEEIAGKAPECCEKEESSKTETQPEPMPAARTSSYTVVSGDSLWGISAMDDIYADPYQWPLIYRLNSGQIEDADLIYPGQVFSIDRVATSSDVDAAIAHAKSRGAWSIGVVEDSDREYLSQ